MPAAPLPAEPAPPDAALVAAQVTKRFAGLVALDRVDLVVAARRDRRADRAQRFRQDHADQRSSVRASCRPPRGGRDRRAGHRRAAVASGSPGSASAAASRTSRLFEDLTVLEQRHGRGHRQRPRRRAGGGAGDGRPGRSRRPGAGRTPGRPAGLWRAAAGGDRPRPGDAPPLPAAGRAGGGHEPRGIRGADAAARRSAPTHRPRPAAGRARPRAGDAAVRPGGGAEQGPGHRLGHAAAGAKADPAVVEAYIGRRAARADRRWPPPCADERTDDENRDGGTNERERS